MSTGLSARRATGLIVAESEESFIRTESVARWSREGRPAYEVERGALLFVFLLFFDRCKAFQSGRKLLHQRGSFFFSFRIFRFHFHCFCGGAAVPCCAFSFVHTACLNKKISTLSGVCTYARHVSERSGRNRPRREAYMASKLFSPEACRRDSWHCQVASLQLQS